MNETAPRLTQQGDRSVAQPVAGVLAGLVAGAAYLAAQVGLTALARAGGEAEPFQRIAAILMGPDVAPPPAHFDFTVFGMALIIHFGLAMLYGRLVCAFVWRRPMPSALWRGVVVGIALYAVNYELIAPLAFPWFAQSVRLVTVVDHALFGALAAATCVMLRRDGSV